MTKEEKLKMFANELGDIKDSNLKKFAEKMIEGADDYFFSVPASSSGKYHPTFDLGVSGLVRHSRCVAFFAKCLAESMDWNEHDTDLIIIAALAHDIRKQGDNTGHTVREHPTLAKEYVMKLCNKNKKLISLEDAAKIGDAVQCHMGKWEHHKQFLKEGNEPFPMPTTEFEKALQAADYIASRKEILDFKFRPTDEVNVEVEEPKAYTGNPGDYVITFGKKYGGKNMTIKEIQELEKNTDSNRSTYIEWMAGQDDFHFTEARDMARKYLEELKNPKPAKKIVEKEVDNTNVTGYNIDDLPF